MFWSFNYNMNGHHHKYAYVDMAFCNYFITIQREPMISNIVKNSWNWNFADFKDLVLILPEATNEAVP